MKRLFVHFSFLFSHDSLHCGRVGSLVRFSSTKPFDKQEYERSGKKRRRRTTGPHRFFFFLLTALALNNFLSPSLRVSPPSHLLPRFRFSASNSALFLCKTIDLFILFQKMADNEAKARQKIAEGRKKLSVIIYSWKNPCITYYFQGGGGFFSKVFGGGGGGGEAADCFVQVTHFRDCFIIL